MAEGVPIGEPGILPAAEPFEAVGHVGDFVVVDTVEEGGGVGIADGAEGVGEVAGEVEVGLFEGEAEAGDVIDGALHAGDGAPEEAADGEVAEVDAAGLHAVEVEAGVFLFVEEGVEDAAAEGGWGVGEAEEDEGHQFDGEQFMIGEEVEEAAAFVGLVELGEVGEA